MHVDAMVRQHQHVELRVMPDLSDGRSSKYGTQAFQGISERKLARGWVPFDIGNMAHRNVVRLARTERERQPDNCRLQLVGAVGLQVEREDIPTCQCPRQDIERLSGVDHHRVRAVRGSERLLCFGWPRRRRRNDIAIFSKRLKLISSKEAELRRSVLYVWGSGLFGPCGDACRWRRCLARNVCWRALVAESSRQLICQAVKLEFVQQPTRIVWII